MFGRTSRRLLWCWLSFCCSCSFRFQATLPCHRHSTLASQAREGLHQLWALPRILLIAFSFSSTASATVLRGHFLPTGVFYLTLLLNIFGTTCFYQGLPSSRQFFLEVCRASYWSSKHRSGPSVCLIHSNPQSLIHLKFVFIHVNIAKSFTCGENFDKKILFFWFSVLDKIRLSSRSATTLISQQPWKHKAAATLISNHKLQNNCSLKKYISEHKCKNYVNLWIINNVLTIKMFLLLL